MLKLTYNKKFALRLEVPILLNYPVLSNRKNKAEQLQFITVNKQKLRKNESLKFVVNGQLLDVCNV